MALLITPPEPIAFSKDRVIFQFEDDREGIIPGIKAFNALGVQSVVPVGAQLVFQWGEKELRFYASATPDAGSNFIPAYLIPVGNHEAYIKSLVPYFANNYFINEDFEVTADSTSTDLGGQVVITWAVHFNARKSGSKYNFNLRTFNGGKIHTFVSGTEDSTNINNSVFIELHLCDRDDENPERIWKGAIELDTKGQASIDVGAILHAYLVPEIPSFILPVAEKCKDSRRKYYLRYAQASGENLSNMGKLLSTDEFVILRGGFGEMKGAPVTLTSKLKAPAGTEDKILMLQKKQRFIRADQPVFLTWVNFGDLRQVHASVDVTFADGTTTVTNSGPVRDVKQHEKVMFGVGFKQLNLDIMQGNRGTIASYTVQVRDDLGPVSEPLVLTLNYAHLEYVRYFAYVNSWGAMDTIMTYGRQSDQWKVYKESCEKVMPINFGSTESQFVEWNQEYENSGEVASGWMRKSDLAGFLDLFIAPLKFRIIEGNAYPVAINSDTIERGRDGDNLYGIVFGYQYARRYDSLEAEELENDDVSDYIPPNVLTAATIIIDGGGTSGGNNGGTGIRMDPYPILGSRNAVESSALFVLLQQKQDVLPLGDATQIYRADGSIVDFKKAVNAVETDPTVPSYAKSLKNIQIIMNDLVALSEFRDTINGMEKDGTVPDYAKSLEGIEQILTDLEFIKLIQNPVFSALPPVVVQKGVPFVKYIDLKLYKTSHHEFNELKVDVQFNNLKLQGVEVSVDNQLVVKLTGTINEEMTPSEQMLLVISDLTKKQTTLSIVVQTINEEIPDDREICPVGPFHHFEKPITANGNAGVGFWFHGGGVTRLGWKIVNKETDTTTLRAGEVTPTSPEVAISFPELPNGTYLLGIAGVNCKSPWAFRPFTIGTETPLAWADGYPIYEGGEIKLKLKNTTQQLVEIYNNATNAKLYSATRDFIADTTEISIANQGGYPTAHYRVNVGALEGMVTVGQPVDPPLIIWQLQSGWDGPVIRDLMQNGEYEGSLPAGFNISIRSLQTGFRYNIHEYKLEYETAPGQWEVMYTGGSSGDKPSASILHTNRLFPNAGVDSRNTNWEGAPINRHGRFRQTHVFKMFDEIIHTLQRTFRFSKLEFGANGNWEVAPGAEKTILVGSVKYNGQAVITQQMQFIEPWGASGLGLRRFEWSVNGVDWHETSAYGSAELVDKVGLLLLDKTVPKTMPDGSVRSVRLRNGMNHNIVSDPITIDQRGIVSGTMSLKLIAQCLPEHFDLKWTIGNDGYYTFRDDCTFGPQDGYEFWYVMNGTVVKRSTSLADYRYDNFEQFSFVKMHIRIGEVNTYNWANGLDEAAGRGFSKNTSYAFYTGIFNKK
jgi:hypothetical protein